GQRDAGRGDARTAQVGRCGGGLGVGTRAAADAEPVEVGSAVGGGGGGPDGVASGGQGGGDGDVGPGVPVGGGVERHSGGHQGAVNRDIHRPVGGGPVGVAHRQLRGPRVGRADRPLHIRAGHVGVVDEAGTGEA